MRALALALVVSTACSGESDNSGAPAPKVERAASVPESELPPPPVPAAAPGLYTLPSAPPELSLPITQATYLVVTAEGALSTGTTGKGTFPGQTIDRADVVQAFAPPLARGDAGPVAAVDAGPPQDVPDVEDVTGLSGKLTRAIDTAAPLLVADGTLRSGVAIELATVVERVQLAVAAPGDPAARALAATFTYREHVPLESGAVRVALVAGRDFATELVVARAAAAPQALVLVAVDDALPMADLVGALLALQRAQVDRFFLTTSRLRYLDGPPLPSKPRPIDAARDVTVGTPVVVGPAAPAAVRRVVTKWSGYLGACFRRRGPLDEPLAELPAGEQRAVFTIGRTGKTGQVQVNDLGDRGFQRCTSRIFRGMRFPRARAPSRVNLPIQYGVR